MIFVTSYGFNGDLQHGGGSAFFTNAMADGFAGADRLCESVAAVGTGTKVLSSHWKALLYGNNATRTIEDSNSIGEVLGMASGGDFVGVDPIPTGNKLMYNENRVTTNSTMPAPAPGVNFNGLAWTGMNNGYSCTTLGQGGQIKWSNSGIVGASPQGVYGWSGSSTAQWQTYPSPGICNGTVPGMNLSIPLNIGLYCVQQ